jgi:hypothetical protein
MPMMRILIAAIMLSVGAAGALAEPAPSPTDKAAISKACSDQANAKNLHGKARKKLRSECKAKGGKA